MSADACLVYYGLRFEVPSDQVEALEMRSDPRIQAARRTGLRFYWANFGGQAERYLLFIGAEVGVLGPEDRSEVNIAPAALETLFAATRAKLEVAGLTGEPSLHLQWLPDV